MKVLKRDGSVEVVSFDKVLRRIENLSSDLNIDCHEIAQKVCNRIYDGVKTSELDELTATMCCSLIAENPDYDKLGSRIMISNHQKKTSPSFSETIDILHGNPPFIVSRELYDIVQKHKDKLNSYIDYNRDYNFDCFGFKTLERAYLLKVNDKIVERPQHMFMRVALGIHGDDIKDALETYDAMSTKKFLHATPTLFNFGTTHSQGSSCFLLHTSEDSIDGIFNTLHDCAMISKYSGGIGLHIHNVRAKNSTIRGTNGNSDGIIPMLRVFNSTARYVNQCFTPETMITTRNGPKQISDIIPMRDEVITLDGTFKRVLEKVVNHVDKTILCMRTKENDAPVCVTEEHDIYVVAREDGSEVKDFVQAKDIQVGDKTFFPATIYASAFHCTILSIETMSYKGNVYDLNIEDNHNYLVSHLGIVHNSGKRNGSMAIYLEPWHADIEPFLELRKNHGNEEERARDLFYALWIPDLFMERVRANGMWSLMCPDECKGLSDVYGKAFDDLYTRYEKEGKFKKQVRAQDLWLKILDSQIETGTPYMLYKDHVNRKTNHQNLGTIKSSNLCVEIMEYTSPDEIAVCNLASLCLPSYVEDGKFNFAKLGHYTQILCKNLNKIIDRTFYPVDKARKSNLRHRPIGIGVQGLSDTYMLMRYPYESPEAIELNKKIFETIYYHAMLMSMEIAKKREEVITSTMPSDNAYDVNLNEYEMHMRKYRGAYSTFDGSPLSKGLFQFDMWEGDDNKKPSMYDWDKLREDVMRYGVRNSLLLAPMPTASTSQIMGFTESFEIITSNIYKRKTLAGEFIIINKYLLQDLIRMKLWSKEMKDLILINEGSIQNITTIPQHIRDLYKTAWEIKQKIYIDQAADRGRFICQSQSMNIFLEVPDYNKLNSIHFYTWSKGLKSGMYYLRTKPKANAQQFTIDPNKSKSNILSTSSSTENVCESCSA